MPEQNRHEPDRVPGLTDEELQGMLDELGETDITVEELKVKIAEIEEQGDGYQEAAGGDDSGDFSDEEIQQVLDDLGETEITVEQLRVMRNEE